MLDEGALPETTLAPLRNLAAALFRMENSRGKKTREEVILAIRPVLKLLSDWLKGSGQDGLRRDFVTWLLRVLLPNNLPDVQLPEVIELQEMHNMLYETAQAWYKEAEAKGRKEGWTEGKSEGWAEGKSEGWAEGNSEGWAEGNSEGWAKGNSEGWAKGNSEGKAEILISLLETKFGTLDAGVYARIHGLDSEELQTCSKRLFIAQTVEEVFGKTH